MRIGIWCDYGFTLGPSEGIGVFVDNLARGLVKADPGCQVVLKAHQGQSSILDSTVAGGLGRISVTTGPFMSRYRRRVLRNCKKIRRRLNQPGPNRFLLYRLDRWAQRTIESINAPIAAELDSELAKCDVWLVPYVGCDQDFKLPTVVAIHDLVSYHFPEMMTPAKLDALKRLVDRVSSRATLAVCMSNFICQHDLLDTLHLPPQRVRVLQSAVPDDLVAADANDAGRIATAKQAARDALPFPIETPYIFYPAAFRTYKNHRYLVEALALYKKKSGLPLKLVFTGIHRCPKPLETRIHELKLSRDVVVLKKVPRDVLKQLYSCAFATVVPSLYEQGSFPIMEALSAGCPVASADIPSLREQFAGMGKSMFYFDPYRPEQLVPILEDIAANRQQVIAAQAAGFTAMRERTWQDAAHGWLSAFREAILLKTSIDEVQRMQRAA